jgi:hypothetical protein
VGRGIEGKRKRCHWSDKSNVLKLRIGRHESQNEIEVWEGLKVPRGKRQEGRASEKGEEARGTKGERKERGGMEKVYCAKKSEG